MAIDIVGGCYKHLDGTGKILPAPEGAWESLNAQNLDGIVKTLPALEGQMPTWENLKAQKGEEPKKQYYMIYVAEDGYEVNAIGPFADRELARHWMWGFSHFANDCRVIGLVSDLSDVTDVLIKKPTGYDQPNKE